MFIWDFAVSGVMDQFLEWVYGQLIGFFGNFFSQMGDMGAELFDLDWVQAVVQFFSYLGWALFGVGLIVAVFEFVIEAQNGRGNFKDTSLNAIKGFLAVGCFTMAPVELYKLSVSLQASFTANITGYGKSIGDLAKDIVQSGGLGDNPSTGIWDGIAGTVMGGLTQAVLIIMIGYAVIKCFFANLKRGGILLIQISVGSLYMFSVPRGYMDGFTQWCKQIIGLCLTAFLQATILTAGLMVVTDHILMGIGLMLAAGEVPRICGAFGLDTSTRANIMSAVYAAQSAINTTKTIVQTVSN